MTATICFIIIFASAITIYFSRRAAKDWKIAEQEWKRAEELWKQAARDWERAAELSQQATRRRDRR